MSDLSPAAFMVWDAAWDCPIGDCKSIEDARRHQIAAALRAAADQVAPDGCAFLWPAGTPGQIRAELLAIAAELEGAQ